MVSNTTGRFRIEDYYVACALSTLFALISILISLSIFIIVWKTKPRLHTINHLLICNTAFASIVYCLVIINNYIYLLFVPWNLDDMSCRFRAYFAYIGISGVIYSYLIQSISRLFVSIFSTKYRFLSTFRMHFILIGTQWFAVILVPLSVLITKDIQMTPLTLCWIPVNKMIHLIVNLLFVYVIPVVVILVIYVCIYQHVRGSSRRATTITNATHSQKRDLQLLRNILILLLIYLGGSLTTLLYFATSIKVIYLISLVNITFTITAEKIFTLVLDREVRQVIINIVRGTTPVVPFQNTMTTFNK
ncbi:unnamed protein product [Adineta ricciae]|nr:unnamed protein product [Adineta ricciae]